MMIVRVTNPSGDDTYVFSECKISTMAFYTHDKIVDVLDNLNDVMGGWTMIHKDKILLMKPKNASLLKMMRGRTAFYFEENQSAIHNVHNVKYGVSNHLAYDMHCDDDDPDDFTLPFPIPTFPIWLEEVGDCLFVYTETEEDAMQLRLML